MAAEIFCCSQISPYRPTILDHEAKFRDFIRWERLISDTPENITSSCPSALLGNSSAYAMQVVRQVNYGPVKWKRYFGSNGVEQGGSAYKEVVEQDLIEANYEKLNTYKNFKCPVHNLFFEFNIYKKNPVNKHHWRANIARPAGDIDLNPGGSGHSVTAQPGHSREAQNELPAKNEEKEGERNDEEKAGRIKEEKVDYEGKDNASGPKIAAESLLLERLELDDDCDVYNDHEDRDGYSAYGHDSGSDRDYTACSANDCGYCGKCAY